MRVLLDEQLPRQLARYFVGHEVRTVQQQAWAGLKNGILLTTAQAAGVRTALRDEHGFRDFAWRGAGGDG